MKKIVFQNNFAYLYFTNSFYDKKKISEALNIYKNFINGNIGELGKYIIVKIESKSKKYSLKTLANELTNYIISLEYEVKK